MRDCRLKYIIYMVSNCIVYSKGYYLFEDDSVLGMIWSLSHYIFLGLAYIKISELVNFKEKKKIKILQVGVIYILLISIMICAFICSSSLENNVKNWSFIIELILIIALLIIYYKLTRNIVLGQQNIQEDSMTNVDTLYQFIHEKTGSEDEKKQVMSTLWLVICSILLGFNYFLLPLILRAIRADDKTTINAYIIAGGVLLITIYIKNILYFIHGKEIYWNTLLEFSGISMACIADAYWNVHCWLVCSDVRSIYFGPYVLMAIGSIPFLISADKNIKNYTHILNSLNNKGS